MLGIDSQIHDQFDSLVKLDEMDPLDDIGCFAKLVRARLDLLARFFDILSRFPSHRFSYPSTSRPMLRAVPITVRTAESRFVVFKSGSLVLAISSTCLRV